MASLTGTPIYNPVEQAPVRSELHLAFIRTLPCVVRGCRRKAEAAHIGPHGIRQRASDLSTAPICHKHHRTDTQSLHKIGRERFDRLHGINLLQIAQRLASKPRLRVESGFFVALIQEEEYVLRPIQDGVLAAMRAAIAVCRENAPRWVHAA